MNKVRIIQLSDPHLGPDAEFRLAGVCTSKTFQQVLEQVVSSGSNIDALVASGDIAAHGDPEAYQLFDQQIGTAGLPFYWLPGNHDEIAIMEDNLSVPFQLEVIVGNWLLLMLTSKQDGKVGGRVSEEEMIRACTAALKHDGPVAVFVHHPPIAVGSAWIDSQQIENGDELLQRLSDCGNVRVLFAGHVHQPYSAVSRGIAIHTTPSTCFQFAANSESFAIGEEPPGFRWIDLYEDGSFETGTIQINSGNSSFDRDCVGY